MSKHIATIEIIPNELTLADFVVVSFDSSDKTVELQVSSSTGGDVEVWLSKDQCGELIVALQKAIALAELNEVNS